MTTIAYFHLTDGSPCAAEDGVYGDDSLVCGDHDRRVKPLPGVQVADIQSLTIASLVREFADLRVWFAVNEVERRHPDGQRKHARLGVVVDELRRRNVLD